MADVYYLTVADLCAIASDVVGGFVVREPGMLASAAARPATVVFGVEAYPTLWEKAAALLHSLTCITRLLTETNRSVSPRRWSFSLAMV